MVLMHDYESGEPYWVIKKEYDDYMEMREAFYSGIRMKLAGGEKQKGTILVSCLPLNKGEELKNLWDDYKAAKDEVASMLGVSQDREGLVKYFQTAYPLDDEK